MQCVPQEEATAVCPVSPRHAPAQRLPGASQKSAVRRMLGPGASPTAQGLPAASAGLRPTLRAAADRAAAADAEELVWEVDLTCLEYLWTQYPDMVGLVTFLAAWAVIDWADRRPARVAKRKHEARVEGARRDG